MDNNVPKTATVRQEIARQTYVVLLVIVDGGVMEIILHVSAYLTGKQEKILGHELFAAMAHGKHH